MSSNACPYMKQMALRCNYMAISDIEVEFYSNSHKISLFESSMEWLNFCKKFRRLDSEQTG